MYYTGYVEHKDGRLSYCTPDVVSYQRMLSYVECMDYLLSKAAIGDLIYMSNAITGQGGVSFYKK